MIAHFAGPPPLRPIASSRGNPGGRGGADQGVAPAGAEPRPSRAGAGAGLIVVTQGQEVRQRLACRGVAP